MATPNRVSEFIKKVKVKSVKIVDLQVQLFHAASLLPPSCQENPTFQGLRVASSDDHVSFESGSDLLGKDGHPWMHPLYRLPQSYSLYEKLREEKFVSDDFGRVLSPLLSIQNFHKINQQVY